MSPCELTDLEIKMELLCAYLLVPLFVNTEKEVIVLVVFGVVREPPSCIKPKHCWFKYMKKTEREF